MKYIVMSVCYGDVRTKIRQLVPIIFPSQMVHEQVFDAIRPLYEINGPVQIVSAGDVTFNSVECCGDSETLDVKSRDAEDDRLINTYDYLHGIE